MQRLYGNQHFLLVLHFKKNEIISIHLFLQAEIAQNEACETFEQMSDKAKEGELFFVGSFMISVIFLNHYKNQNVIYTFMNQLI